MAVESCLCEKNFIITKRKHFNFNILRGDIYVGIYTKIEDLTWQPHSLAAGAQIKPLVTKRDDNLNVSCILVKIPAGIEIPEHVHAEQVDILYPLSGRAEMYVEKKGAFVLEPGIVVRVPMGAKHKIFNVTEALLIYDVFHPANI